MNPISARPLEARRPGDVATADSPPTPPEATPAAALLLPPPPTNPRPPAALANGATKQRPADLAVVLPEYTKMVADKTQCRAKYGRRDYFPMGQRRKPPMLCTFPGRYAPI